VDIVTVELLAVFQKGEIKLDQCPQLHRLFVRHHARLGHGVVEELLALGMCLPEDLLFVWDAMLQVGQDHLLACGAILFESVWQVGNRRLTRLQDVLHILFSGSLSGEQIFHACLRDIDMRHMDVGWRQSSTASSSGGG
jgi:hypothetical protein